MFLSKNGFKLRAIVRLQEAAASSDARIRRAERAHATGGSWRRPDAELAAVTESGSRTPLIGYPAQTGPTAKPTVDMIWPNTKEGRKFAKAQAWMFPSKRIQVGSGKKAKVLQTSIDLTRTPLVDHHVPT
jgi:hypothetical protein